MGWLSDRVDDVRDSVSSAADSVTDAVSSGWESTKDAVKDVTGVDSMTSFMMMPGLSTAIAALGGQGVLGEGLYGALAPLTGQQQQGPAGGGQMTTGPLMNAAPQSLTFGSGGQPAPQVVSPSGQDLASLFGESGYQYGPSSPQTSAALLQSNPEAYQYSPLVSGLA